LEKAVAAAKRDMAYIHVFSPCPTGWRFPPNMLIEIGRKAVETNIVPLWEYEPEIKIGGNKWRTRNKPLSRIQQNRANG
jgi:phenylglyoxylate dehydrogenase beta subunit